MSQGSRFRELFRVYPTHEHRLSGFRLFVVALKACKFESRRHTSRGVISPSIYSQVFWGSSGRLRARRRTGGNVEATLADLETRDTQSNAMAGHRFLVKSQ